jgi:hypothetical protein
MGVTFLYVKLILKREERAIRGGWILNYREREKRINYWGQDLGELIPP